MMWRNATSTDVYGTLPPPSGNGWIQKSNAYIIDWEFPKVEGDIRSNTDFFMKGHTCKKGCKTKGCGCKKRGQTCGPSCECHNCINVTMSRANTSIIIPHDTSDEEDENCHNSTDDAYYDSRDENNSNDDNSNGSDGDYIEVKIIMDTNSLISNIEII